MRREILITLSFLLAELIGLLFGLRAIYLFSEGKIQPVFSSPSDLSNSLYLFLGIFLSSFFILFLIRIKRPLIKYLEAFITFFLVAYAIGFFLPPIIAFIFSFLIVFWSSIKPKWFNKNLCALLSVYSASSLLGISLGLIPLLLFGTLLSVYDFISVFITKHMIVFAEEFTRRPSSFLLIFPSKKQRKVLLNGETKIVRFFAIGTGDLLIPLTFAVALLNSGYLIASISSILVSSLFLFVLLRIQKKEKNQRVYPALPFIFCGSLLGFILSLIC